MVQILYYIANVWGIFVKPYLACSLVDKTFHPSLAFEGLHRDTYTICRYITLTIKVITGKTLLSESKHSIESTLICLKPERSEIMLMFLLILALSSCHT